MSSETNSDLTEQVQELKARGNEAYTNGDYQNAIIYFTKAIELDNKNETLYCNRSMAHSSLLQWEDAVQDAKMVKLDFSIFFNVSVGY